MFYDVVQKKMSRPNQKCHKIVVETRPKVYSKRVRDLETGEIQTVIIAEGTEIVKEIWTTEEGVCLWNEQHSSKADEDK